MAKQPVFEETDLAALAKRFRSQAGKTKAEVAREIGVSRPTMQQAEEYPELSLTKLRIKLIERFSPYKVVGPLFLLVKK